MVLSELIELMQAKNRDLPGHAVEAAVRRVFDEIADALADGGRVELRRFGTLSVRAYEPRTVRDPRTGAAIGAKAMKSVHFKASKMVADALNDRDARPTRVGRAAKRS